MDLENFELGGISSSDGVTVAAGEQGVMTFTLTMWRSALRLEINSKSGMIAARGVDARHIVPQLVALGIVEMDTARITKAKKIKAYNALNAFLVSKGAPDRPL